MYAAAYQAYEVLNQLIETEYETMTEQDTVVRIEQQIYFIPKHSSVIHIALCTGNDKIINKVLSKIRMSSPIYSESNTLQFTPIVFMSGLNQSFDPLIEQYLCRQNKFESLLILNNAVQVNNHILVKKFINQSHKNVQLKELIYEFVFDLSQRAPTQPNEAEQLLLKQQELAIVYALQKRGNKWDTCLRNMFGDDLEKVKREHEEVIAFKNKPVTTIKPEDLEARFNVLAYEEVVAPPRLECLPKSQLQEDQLKWFEACRNGETAVVKQGLEKYNGLIDDRSSLEDECFYGFTGLMYSIYSGQLDVFQTLLPYEFHISTCKDLTVKISGQRYYLLPAGSTVVNLICVMGHQDFFTFLLQQKDNRLYG